MPRPCVVLPLLFVLLVVIVGPRPGVVVMHLDRPAAHVRLNYSTGR